MVGLKYSSQVTPCVGVWIETGVVAQQIINDLVTPCVGVWIETYSTPRTPWAVIWSHPAWVCGLKLATAQVTLDELQVTPCVGVWIETALK